MKIKKRSMGPVQSNTYYLEKDNQVIVIDPCLDLGYDANQLLEPIKDKHVIAVLITHGHLLCGMTKSPTFTTFSLPLRMKLFLSS